MGEVSHLEKSATNVDQNDAIKLPKRETVGAKGSVFSR
jgi:hypothetical protein